MNLAELSLKRPVTVIMVFISMTVIGLLAAVRLPLEQFPAIDVPVLFVQVPYAGSTPHEVERTITRPIEEALSTLPGIQRMWSSSGTDQATIRVEFKWDTDIAIKAVQARERIDAIRSELPADVQRYYVMKFSTSDQPLLQLRISGEGRDLSSAYQLLERRLKRPLERIPGVARVDIQGVGQPQVEIGISPQRLSAHHVDLNALYQRLKQANFSVSAGEISDHGVRYRLQPEGSWHSLDDIRALPVNDQGLTLGDIATVTLKPKRLDYARHLDGKPAIGIDIYRERNANLVQVGRAVMAKVKQIQKDPQLRGVRVYALDNQADSVTTSLRELAKAGLEGTALAVLVLFFFLRDWPSTLMVSLAIPLCFAITLGCMYFLGISLNVLSMMGLLLATGMLVDNAVVVVESIYHYREQHPDRPWYAAVHGTQVVGIAIAAGTFTSVVVFLPNIFGEKNNISIFLAQIAIAMSIAHLASWLVAVTLVPMCASRLPPPKFIGRQSAVSRLRDRYQRLVGWTLRHRRWTGAGVALLMVLSFIPLTHTKVDMFDDGASPRLRIFYQLNANYRLDQIKPSVDRIEHYLQSQRKRLHIKSVYSYWDNTGNASTDVLLDPDSPIPPHQVMEDLRKGLPKIAIGKPGFQWRSNDSGITLSLTGDSSDRLRELAKTVIPVLNRLPALRDVHADRDEGNREARIHVDRTRAKLYGFDASSVGNYLAVALRGMPLREYQDHDRDLPVWLRFGGQKQPQLKDLDGYTLRTSDGQSVPLLSLLRLSTSTAPTQIERTNRRTSLQIKASLAPKQTTPEARKQISAAMQAINLPAGYAWSFGQGFDRDQKAGQQMLFNTLLALLLVYVVMCAMFESLVFPAAILTTFIFSVLGVFWLFWATGTTFSIMAAIGILILMGVVVNNGIVMIVHINQLRHEGLPRGEALMQGAGDRLRPILMTMGTAILAMLPLSLGNTQAWNGGPPYFPMARAIAGGLLFSTLVTLIALPCIYSWLDDMRMATRRVFADARAGRIRRPPATEAAGS